LIPLLFQNRFIIGYLKIIAKLIIVVDLKINTSAEIAYYNKILQ